MPLDKIAALAGVSRSTTQNALREARRLGLVTVTERRRQGAKSLTNVVEIVLAEWAAWLKLGAKGYRVQNNKSHGIQIFSFNKKGSETVVDTARGPCGHVSHHGIKGRSRFVRALIR